MMSPSTPFDTAADFDAAVKYAKALRGLSKPQKSEVYGTYKCATVGPCPSSGRPSAFNVVARGKYDGWAKASKALDTRESAKQRYVQLISELSKGEHKDPSIAKRASPGSPPPTSGTERVLSLPQTSPEVRKAEGRARPKTSPLPSPSHSHACTALLAPLHRRAADVPYPLPRHSC